VERPAVPLVAMSAELSLQLLETGKWESGSRKQKAQIYPSLSSNSVHQFKLNISLLKSEVQPQNTALVKLLTYKIKVLAICEKTLMEREAV